MNERVAVLCVDDDASLIDLTATFLERQNDEFTVITETSASDGLDRLAEESIDCIVSDYEMPRMDGLDFLDAVREDHPDLPFILFTGKGSEEVAEDAIHAGVTDYLQKGSGTSNYAVLANRIENAVGQYHAELRADSLKEEYELVAETATDAFWTIDLLTESLSLSEGIQQFGYAPDTDLEREWFFEHVHPEDRDCLREFNDALLSRESEAFDELRADRGRFSEEYRFQRADGTYAYVEGRGILVFEGDTPAKMVGTMADVTERKEREQDLKEAYERMELALESTDAFLWEWDPDSDTATLYPSSPSVFGREVGSHEEALEQIHPEDQPRLNNVLKDAINSEDPFSVEFRIDSEGEIRWVLNEGRVIVNEQTGAKRVLGVTKDITERLEQEKELERKTERLEKFAGVLSHDLRNPLGVAQGYLELAQAESDSPYLDNVDDALARMDSLIEDVLTLAREDEALTATDDVSLQVQAERAWRNVNTETATLEVAESAGTVIGDSDRICRALENLFRNAIEHGGENVTVRIGPLEDGNGFYIEDDGPGIPENTGQLFEWGYSTKGKGMGFGLASVEQIVNAHGWEITATNGNMGGARFEISTRGQKGRVPRRLK